MKRLFLIGIGLIVCARALALPLWELEGTNNRVRILGSVHFLRASDYPLPQPIMSAYADADVVVFELNLGDVDPLTTQAMLQELAIDPRGNDLADYLGTRNYRDATSMAAEIDIDIAMLRPYEPWFAALQITQLRLAQLGFDGSWGIETQLTLRAVGDGKEITGLETLEQQFDALDSLPPAAQREFLMTALEDATEIADELDMIIAAWKRGDVDMLETELLAGLADQAELHDRILVRRNRDWTRQIAEFSRDDRNYLVVVGALHLVGEDSVIRMLEDRGIRAKQIR